MKRALLLAFSLIRLTAVAQTNIDKLVEQLDLYSKGSINNWKYSTDFSSNPTKQGFDDATWKMLKLDEHLSFDSCWIRKEIVLPERILDVTSNGYGVSLLNNSKYGYDVKGSTMRLSLLRSPKWPDPTADRGKHSVEYALYPHHGSWQEANTVKRGYEYNNPLIPIIAAVHKGNLPPRRSFVRLAPKNLILTTVKKAEESDAWIIEWYDAEGTASTSELDLPLTPKRVFRSSFLEEDGERIVFTGSHISVSTKAHGVTTLKVFF